MKPDKVMMNRNNTWVKIGVGNLFLTLLLVFLFSVTVGAQNKEDSPSEDGLTITMDGVTLQVSNKTGVSVSGLGVEQISGTGPSSVAMLQDDFDSENQGQGMLNYFGLANWDIARGSVDLIGYGFWDFFPTIA